MNKMQLKKYWPSSLALLLFVAMAVWSLAITDGQDKALLRAESVFKQLDQTMQMQLHSMATSAAITNTSNDYCSLLFENGQLKQWSDNHPAFQNISLSQLKDGSIITLPNGKYWIRKIERDHRVAVGLLLIKQNFPFENHHLINDYNPVFGFEGNMAETSGGTAFHAPNGTTIATLAMHDTRAHPLLFSGWLVAMLLSLFQVMLLSAGFSSITRWQIMIALVVVRAVMIAIHFPEAIYASKLFGPTVYASSYFFGSLGDLFLNAIWMLLLVVVLPAKNFFKLLVSLRFTSPTLSRLRLAIFTASG